MAMSKKKERQFTIKQIVQEDTIENQANLLKQLKKKGFRTTQATLSRDLHEMGIVRAPAADGYRYVIAEQEGTHFFNKVIGMEILGVHHNENTLVVKTITGRAKGVAIFIDQLKHRNIVATLAGENAIIVVPDSVQNIAKIKKDLEAIAYQ
jgi:transcriptional regulator of arginine metabolism